VRDGMGDVVNVHPWRRADRWISTRQNRTTKCALAAGVIEVSLGGSDIRISATTASTHQRRSGSR
jgi:hypothetical protein